MTRFALLLLLTALPLFPAVHPANLDRIIEETRKAFDVPGLAVAIVHNGQTVYAKGFGVRKLGDPSPVTPDTRFAIGSTTKAFTTAAMAILTDEKKMDWDDPVRKHVPFFRLSDPLADSHVTLRDIVSHRTGLSRHDLLWYNSPFSREEIIRKIGLVSLTKPFRALYQYQNIMFSTAGYAVGLADGSSWESFVQRRILDPLGMKNTDFSAATVIHAPDYSQPHEKRDGKLTVIPWRNLDNIGPAGSINSSVNDLSRWARLHLDKGQFASRRIISEAAIKETHTPQTIIRVDDPNSRSVNEGTNMMAYGLGWTIQDYRGHHMVAHGGAIDGFRAQVALLPNDNYAIVILANLGSNNMPEALRAAIADDLLGLSANNWNQKYLAAAKAADDRAAKARADRAAKRHKDAKPSLDLAAYAGAYHHPAYGTASVHAANGALSLHWSNWKLPLTHHHHDTFLTSAESSSLRDAPIEFRLNADGQPVSLKFIEQEFTRQ